MLQSVLELRQHEQQRNLKRWWNMRQLQDKMGFTTTAVESSSYTQEHEELNWLSLHMFIERDSDRNQESVVTWRVRETPGSRHAELFKNANDGPCPRDAQAKKKPQSLECRTVSAFLPNLQRRAPIVPCPPVSTKLSGSSCCPPDTTH